ncbi:MAG: TrmB family transcriptional regulator [Chloroflexi bacterium AL-W]|nr:TrmB family transcriptional regulator [Chloroflexi bacterium AL-N1]NOK67139.1 TrmB family transcriptional regulator [Chloroflexi bacterium AL-N10]NOK74568.1 TrmB family transcriptional regulator [Chloroflexi bacterium AL-N5]NOK81741.1 TrmB family transcriptional regulator [Chloroflexi bacterium AL-W]NOK89211.1 TrmB family transcriptional regulator [Chloroflexi bacterium AL-N15]
MDLVDQLIAVGLTEYESKVYLALLREHPATGYQLSKTAGIPRSMVYEALGRLEARGAVLKTQEEKATLYRPVSPETLIDRYEREAQTRFAQLRTGLSPLYTQQDQGQLWNFSGRKEALVYAAEMISQAQNELMLVLADADLEELRALLEEAAKRNMVLGIMLTGQSEFNLGQVVRHPQRETELHRMSETLIIVADEREFLIASGHATTTATVTTNPNMVLIARQFVWMELFAQRIFSRLGDDLLAALDPDDRQILH